MSLLDTTIETEKEKVVKIKLKLKILGNINFTRKIFILIDTLR
jgi:hypothetical protein